VVVTPWLLFEKDNASTVPPVEFVFSAAHKPNPKVAVIFPLITLLKTLPVFVPPFVPASESNPLLLALVVDSVEGSEGLDDLVNASVFPQLSDLPLMDIPHELLPDVHDVVGHGMSARIPFEIEAIVSTVSVVPMLPEIYIRAVFIEEAGALAPWSSCSLTTIDKSLSRSLENAFGRKVVQSVTENPLLVVLPRPSFDSVAVSMLLVVETGSTSVCE
jgi:hypothetical protein